MDTTQPRRLPFCREMFEAWHRGAKDVTRRVIVPQPPDYLTAGTPMCTDGWVALCSDEIGMRYEAKCPYGPPGTPLALCEPFRVVKFALGYGQPHLLVDVEYKWMGGGIRTAVEVPETHGDKPTSQPSKRFHSPRFMPVWAARHFSRVVSLRVERLQDITDEEAVREGFACREHFSDGWNRLNAKRGYPWESNPYVWRIEIAKP